MSLLTHIAVAAAVYSKNGGEGSRTPVHKAVSETFYMLRRSLVSERCCGPSRHSLPSVHEIEFTLHRGHSGGRPACCRRIRS
jgi:hypothetical protein